MKIIKLNAENFMCLKAIEINPKGDTVLITGKNGAGKSSVLDAIVSALCGKKYAPQKPIRDGEERAEVVIETENWIVKRTFTEAGGGSVTITNSDGMRAQSPQKLLDKIVGNLAFDPMLFINYDQRKQYEVVMKLAGLDFSDIDEQVATLKQKRSEVRSIKETYEHEAARIAVGDEVPDEEVSMLEMATKLNEANEHNAKRKAILQDIEHREGVLKEYEKTCEDEELLMADLKDKLERTYKLHAQNSERGRIQAEELTKIARNVQGAKEVEIIEREIATIEETNRLVMLKKQKAELEAKAKAKTQVYAELGKEVKLCDMRKAARLAEAKMPLPGLSVTDDGVVFEGIPLSQVNDAKKLEIGMGIAMAENPELRVIRMKGNDLDDESLNVVSKMAADKDFQLWLERIEGEGGIIIEDGSVKQ